LGKTNGFAHGGSGGSGCEGGDSTKARFAAPVARLAAEALAQACGCLRIQAGTGRQVVRHRAVALVNLRQRRLQVAGVHRDQWLDDLRRRLETELSTEDGGGQLDQWRALDK